ncbi:MAG: dTDP-4-dehydrorhamnose reductase [bacterium]
MRILVAGAGGLVGRAVVRHCTALGDDVFGYAREALDITTTAVVRKTADEIKPEVIINCAAMTDVDGCESDHERAFLINAQGPENLAFAARAVGGTLITISTDYVFDGEKEGFYTQRDNPNPKSVYGKSKLAGERLAQLADAATIVVRTGFVFGEGGRNFLSTVVERAQRGEKLKVISDAWGTPTYARDLAVRLRELADVKLPAVFHVVNSGDGTSFKVFTEFALQNASCTDVDVEPVSVASLSRPAPRPANSRLKCLVSPAIGLPPLPSWHEALLDFIAVQRRAEAEAPV